jgi:hypothetical protein
VATSPMPLHLKNKDNWAATGIMTDDYQRNGN